MNKTDLIKATKEIVAQELEGVTIKDTGVFVEATIKAIQDAVAADNKVQLVGFGTFETVERAERKARNPRTGEECLVKASKAIRFKAAKALKEVINA